MVKRKTTRFKAHTVLIGLPFLTVATERVCPQTYVPDDFELSTVASELVEPTAIAFAPDGRLLVAEKGGRIRIVDNGMPLREPLAELEVYAISESGLLGLAVDPDFHVNRFLYAFATVSASEQRIVRIEERDGQAADVRVLVDNLPTTGGHHNGGCLRVGPDRHLYFSIGDTGRPELSRRLTSLAGKISRVRLDGTVPEDNPFTTPTGAPRAIYAFGFRNPFRFCFASDGRLFVMDVGSQGNERYEEINLVEPGGNYGWPDVEGPDDAPLSGFIHPIFAYRDKGTSIAGCAVYEAAHFPPAYRGNLFHVDFVSHSIFRVELLPGGGVEHSLFARLEGGPVDLALGPDGALYVAEFYTGRVRRISYRLAHEVPIDDTLNPASPHAPATTSGPCGASASVALIAAFVIPFRPPRLRPASPRCPGRRPHPPAHSPRVVRSPV